MQKPEKKTKKTQKTQKTQKTEQVKRSPLYTLGDIIPTENGAVITGYRYPEGKDKAERVAIFVKNEDINELDIDDDFINIGNHMKEPKERE